MTNEGKHRFLRIGRGGLILGERSAFVRFMIQRWRQEGDGKERVRRAPMSLECYALPRRGKPRLYDTVMRVPPGTTHRAPLSGGRAGARAVRRRPQRRLGLLYDYDRHGYDLHDYARRFSPAPGR